MIHPDAPEIATYLYNAKAELHEAGLSRFFMESHLPVQVTDESDSSVIDPAQMERNLDDLFSSANIVALETPIRQRPALHIPLAVAAFAMARKRLTRSMEDTNPEKGGCLMAEMRLVRALQFHTTDQPIVSDHRPGAVVFDEKGKPFAYQKSSGDPTAFAWREAVMITGKGRRLLPASSFFELHYEDEDPLVRYAGAGLISLAEVAPPDYVAFSRFSTCLLPPKIARYGLLGATLRPDDMGRDMRKLQENLDGALALSNEVVASQVHALLRDGRALSAT